MNKKLDVIELELLENDVIKNHNFCYKMKKLENNLQNLYDVKLIKYQEIDMINPIKKKI